MASTSKNNALLESVRSNKHVPWCEDYEKMISGMLYDSFVPELTNGRFRARKLMDKYNKYFPEDATFESLAEDREVMLKELMGSVGKDIFMEPPVYVDYGCNISIGERFYANFKYVLGELSRPMFFPYPSSLCSFDLPPVSLCIFIHLAPSSSIAASSASATASCSVPSSASSPPRTRPRKFRLYSIRAAKKFD